MEGKYCMGVVWFGKEMEAETYEGFFSYFFTPQKEKLCENLLLTSPAQTSENFTDLRLDWDWYLEGASAAR